MESGPEYNPDMKDQNRKRTIGQPYRGKPRRTSAEVPQEEGATRINRYIAQAGVASRRKADELVLEGRVKVNGVVVKEPGTKISEEDVVEVNGRVISPQGHQYILLNKPNDTITTRSDDRGRRTVMDLITLPDEEKAGLFPVGRLDRNTLGVLLLTNDGELAHRLMHPRFEIEKVYQVRTAEPVRNSDVDKLRRGIELDEGVATADHVEFINPNDAREVAIVLHEGKNRQIRRMLESIGHEVLFLERVRYAGLTTQGLRQGRWRKLFPAEVRKLRRLVKLH